MQKSNKEASIVSSQDYQIIEEVPQQSAVAAPQKWLANACGLFIFSCLLILPFLFGGVHESSFRVLRFFCFLLVALIVVFDYPKLRQSLNIKLVRGKIFLVFSALLLMLCLHGLAFWILQLPHPVLTSVSALLAPSIALDLIVEFAAFVSTYAIVSFWLSAEVPSLAARNSRILSNTILLSAFLISLTALSHWFYDNGKLFWIFSANTETTSSRARWPFVNPNHLGIFLIIPIFIAIGKMEQAITDWSLASKQLQRRGKIILSDLVNDNKTQRISRTLVALSLFLLTAGLALIASLSRNAIAATFVFMLLYLLLPKSKKAGPVAYPSPNSGEVVHSEVSVDGVVKKKLRRRTARNNSKLENNIDISKIIPALKRIWRLALILTGMGVLWFFLGEKGGELFRSRLEYALIYTQDDMRWQLYKDSLPMLLESPLFGIGLGNWSVLYPRFMAEGLSGMAPGYLHSDILQIMIETGLVGTLSFFLATLLCLVLLMKKGPVEKNEQSNFESTANSPYPKSVFYGFLAVLVCACFEFPLRIPAINCLLAIVITAEAFRKDKVS